jgi:hypothetical protein
MHRRSIFAMTFLLGCGGSQSEETLADEHTVERAELAQNQMEERQELATEQSEETADERQDQLDELPSQTDETMDAQSESAAEYQRLSTLASQACSGVAMDEQETCPIGAASVDTMRNVEDGIAIVMKRELGTADQVESRLNCYRARIALRSAQAPSGSTTTWGTQQGLGAGQMNGQNNPNQAGQVPTAQNTPATGEAGCLVDYPDVEIDVNETRGRVAIELTANEDGQVTLLRSRARELTRRTPGNRRGNNGADESSPTQ